MPEREIKIPPLIDLGEQMEFRSAYGSTIIHFSNIVLFFGFLSLILFHQCRFIYKRTHPGRSSVFQIWWFPIQIVWKTARTGHVTNVTLMLLLVVHIGTRFITH